jgi:hypothetical protein
LTQGAVRACRLRGSEPSVPLGSWSRLVPRRCVKQLSLANACNVAADEERLEFLRKLVPQSGVLRVGKEALSHSGLFHHREVGEPFPHSVISMALPLPPPKQRCAKQSLFARRTLQLHALQ